MTKVVSQLDEYGYFLGVAVADESPLEAGVYLLPGGCVDAVPPEIPHGKRAKFSGGVFLLEDLPQQQEESLSDDDLRFLKLKHIRYVREGILNRLTGIERAASLTGDTATSSAYLTVRQGLLDITAGLTDMAPALIDVTVLQRYVLLREACTPAMVSAFAQVDA